MSESPNFSVLLQKTTEILKNNKKPLLAICQLLSNKVYHYNWVGFYFMIDSEQTLELGPYIGLKTEHTKISYGKGICGQVAKSGEIFIVDDINAHENYLACSLDTKAEIVVPLYVNGKLIGQIDIDSNKRNPFSKKDEDFLNSLCELISNHPDSFATHLHE